MLQAVGSCLQLFLFLNYLVAEKNGRNTEVKSNSEKLVSIFCRLLKIDYTLRGTLSRGQKFFDGFRAYLTLLTETPPYAIAELTQEGDKRLSRLPPVLTIEAVTRFNQK